MRNRLAAFVLSFSLAGCGFVHDEKLDHEYRLVAIDSLEDMIVCRRTSEANCNGDELPGPTVFAAGANEKYLVIARHPGGARAVTEFYYVIKPATNEPARAKNLVGPLTASGLQLAKQQLGLPEFSRTIESLK